MKKYNVAILGQGRSGRDIHGAYFKTETAKEHFTIVAVADLLPERRSRARQEYGCEVTVTDDYRKLFSRDDIDLVVNATPSPLHVSVTKELLEAGLNVVCEKPAARHAEEVDMLMETARKHKTMYNVFQQSRFAPYFRKIKEVIASGVLGRIIEIDIEFNGFSRRWDWQTLQMFHAGSLLNTGPHPLDQALNLLDMYDGMPSVLCKMDRVNTYGDAEDYVKLILTAPGRPLVDISISSCDMYPSFTYKIHAQYGGLKATAGAMEWKYYRPEEVPTVYLTSTPLYKPDGTPAYCSDKLTLHTESWSGASDGAFTDAVSEYYNMIYNYLSDGVPMEITPYQVRQQIAVIEECHRQNPLPTLYQ